jgi:hypothetical protein
MAGCTGLPCWCRERRAISGRCDFAGENPVRIWREHRKMSLGRLATQAGIGKGYLSQLENGERTGTIETLKNSGVM